MKLIFLIAALCSLLFTGCSIGGRKEATVEEGASASMAMPELAMQRSASNGLELLVKDKKGENDLPVNENTSITQQAKQIIKTAHLIHEVKSNKDYSNYVRNLLKGYGAYISKEDNNASDNKAQTTLVIKVPVALFDSLTVELVTKDVKQLQKNISSEDITSEVIDTRARLETRKATRDKYLEFLKKAGKIEDVLKIQQEINNIQEDIESAEARLALLSGQASYSTINLTYFEPHSGNENYDTNPGFWSRIGKAIKNGAAILGEIFIAFVTAWPFWVAGLVLGFAIRKYRKRNKNLARKDH